MYFNDEMHFTTYTAEFFGKKLTFALEKTVTVVYR